MSFPIMSAPDHLAVEDRLEVAVDQMIATATVIAGMQNRVFEVMIRVLVHDRSSGIQQMLQQARDSTGREPGRALRQGSI